MITMFKPISSAFTSNIGQIVRRNITNNNLINTYFHNRNPRNLERLRIAYKPSGWHVDKPGRSFWHKLQITESSRFITARVIHYNNGPVLEASSSEWAIKRQLYRPKDISAYKNLGKIFAQRCLESGITEVYCDLKPIPDGKIDLFLKSLEEGGVALTEPGRFKKAEAWDAERPEKPWEITE